MGDDKVVLADIEKFDSRFQPGNPSSGGHGVKRGPTSPEKILARDWADKLINENGEYRRNLEDRIMAGSADAMEKYLWERIVGKPKEVVEITSPEPLFVLMGTTGPKTE